MKEAPHFGVHISIHRAVKQIKKLTYRILRQEFDWYKTQLARLKILFPFNQLIYTPLVHLHIGDARFEYRPFTYNRILYRYRYGA